MIASCLRSSAGTIFSLTLAWRSKPLSKDWIAAIAVGRGRADKSRFLPCSSHSGARALADPTAGFIGRADTDRMLHRNVIVNDYCPDFQPALSTRSGYSPVQETGRSLVTITQRHSADHCTRRCFHCVCPHRESLLC